jgi:hypothetical protein
MTVRVSVACALVVSLIAPTRVAFAQDPAPATGDRDLDGFADGADACPDTYGAPPQGCPPQAPPVVTDRDGDGIADDIDACPDVAAVTSTGCPDTTPPGPTPEVAAGDPNDEYQSLLRTLPNDYDLNYTYDAPARKRNRENDPGRAAKRIRALSISGSSLLLLGTVGMIATLSAGLGISGGAKNDLEDMKAAQDVMPTTPVDGSAREDALRKGEVGDKTAIVGSAASGGVMALGTVLLIAARSLKKKTYGTADSGSSGGSMPDKTRRNLTIYGALLVVYGLIGVGAGAVLARNDDDKKAKNGRILLGVGGSMMGLGALLFIPLAINKFKKTARVNAGPMWVRSGGGAGVRVSF